MITFCDAWPKTIVPANRTLSPVCTKPRVEMFASFESAAAVPIQIVRFHYSYSGPVVHSSLNRSIVTGRHTPHDG